MPKVMKPPAEYNPDDVLSNDGSWYDGPLPKPGFYKGPIKKVLIQRGKNGLRWMVLCEIGDGKYKGAGVAKWLQPEGENIKWFNQWLHAMTDGSEAQMKAITKAFKEIGFAVEEKDNKGRLPVVRIGKKFNPIGKVIGFMVKQRTIEGGERDGETVAEISRFVIPRGAEEDDEDTDSPEDILDDEETIDEDASEDVDTEEDSEPDTDDDSAGLDEFDEETTSNPDPVKASAGTDSDDDPWSI